MSIDKKTRLAGLVLSIVFSLCARTSKIITQRISNRQKSKVAVKQSTFIVNPVIMIHRTKERGESR